MCRRESNRESARRARARKAEETQTLEAQVKGAHDKLSERERECQRAYAQTAAAEAKLKQLREERAAMLNDVRCLPLISSFQKALRRHADVHARAVCPTMSCMCCGLERSVCLLVALAHSIPACLVSLPVSTSNAIGSEVQVHALSLQ